MRALLYTSVSLCLASSPAGLWSADDAAAAPAPAPAAAAEVKPPPRGELQIEYVERPEERVSTGRVANGSAAVQRQSHREEWQGRLSRLELWLNRFEDPRAQRDRAQERAFLQELADLREAFGRADPELAEELKKLEQDYLFRTRWDERWKEGRETLAGQRGTLNSGVKILDIPLGSEAPPEPAAGEPPASNR